MTSERGRVAAAGGVAVEMIDRATWLAMRRLAAAGVLQFTHESRVLHRSPLLGDEEVEARSARARALELSAEADRALRMARVLAGGGFNEEAPMLLAKAVRKAAAAHLAGRAELSATSASASDHEIRTLIDCGALPATASTVLDAIDSLAPLPGAADIEPLLATTEAVLAAVAIDDRTLAA
jgi:hypothetical protein